MDEDIIRQFEMQKELQQSQLNQNQDAYAPIMKQQMNEMQSAVIEQVNPLKIVERLMKRFSGIKMNSDGEEYKAYPALLNQEGLSEVDLYLEGVINQGMTMGRMEDKEIKKITIEFANQFAENIGFNWRYWGIKDESTIYTIKNIILINTYSILRRSQDEKKFYGTIAIEHLSQGNQPRKKEEKWLDKLKL